MTAKKFVDVVLFPSNHPRRFQKQLSEGCCRQLGERLQPRERALTLATASGSAAILSKQEGEKTEREKERRQDKEEDNGSKMNPVALSLRRKEKLFFGSPPFRRLARFQRKMNSSTLLARSQTAARPSCSAQQRKETIRATTKRSAMRPTAACVVAALAPLLPASSSIDPRRRLEKVKNALVGAFHFSPFR